MKTSLFLPRKLCRWENDIFLRQKQSWVSPVQSQQRPYPLFIANWRLWQGQYSFLTNFTKPILVHSILYHKKYVLKRTSWACMWMNWGCLISSVYFSIGYYSFSKSLISMFWAYTLLNNGKLFFIEVGAYSSQFWNQCRRNIFHVEGSILPSFCTSLYRNYFTVSLDIVYVSERQKRGHEMSKCPLFRPTVEDEKSRLPARTSI